MYCSVAHLNSSGLFRWERLGDIVVLPVTSFKDPAWDSIGPEVWPIVAKSLNANRLARQVSYILELFLSVILLIDDYFSSFCFNIQYILCVDSVKVCSQFFGPLNLGCHFKVKLNLISEDLGFF